MGRKLRFKTETNENTERRFKRRRLKILEKGLKFATINSDAFTQMTLYKRLVEVKSLLINIR